MLIYSFLQLLEHGCDTFHQPVLWIINEFLIKLEEGGNVEMSIISQIITPPISHLIKVRVGGVISNKPHPFYQGPLWQEALDILMLAIKTSSSLVQPPTPHLPMVDLGFFHESLPGPTLQFKMDLSNGSQDLRLAQDVIPPSPWRRPHGCQVQSIHPLNESTIHPFNNSSIHFVHVPTWIVFHL